MRPTARLPLSQKQIDGLILQSQGAGAVRASTGCSQLSLFSTQELTRKRSWAMLENLAGIDVNTIVNFHRINQSEQPLDARGLGREAIDPRELNDIFLGSDLNQSWLEFHRRHPDSRGYFTLSPPGLNSAGALALVEVADSSGRLSGHVDLSVLARKNDHWVVRTVCPLWVS